MKFHVTIKSFESITSDDGIKQMRQVIGEKLAQFHESGKLLDGAVFVDKRGAYLIFNVDSNEELFRLLTPMQDIANIEIHPLISFETMQKFFSESQ